MEGSRDRLTGRLAQERSAGCSRISEQEDPHYHRISIEPGEVKYTAVDDYLEMSYSSIVGSLIYIAITARPDLAFAIGKVSRGMHQPNPRHIAMLKHLLGYLRKTQNFKMVYKQNNNAVEVLFRQIGDQLKLKQI